MKRKASFVSLAALTAIAAVAIAAPPAPAQPIVYSFTGLPGPAANCAWFDDNLNDRAIESLIRQTDLLYNRVALPAGQSVTVGRTVTAANGTQVVDFDLGGRLICTSAEAVTPPTPTPSPAASPTP